MIKEQVKISIPNKNLPELEYTIFCLFQEFLGVEVELERKVSPDHFIIEGPKGKIFIPNLFFLKEDVNQLYTPQNIPNKVDKAHWELQGKAYPIISLFGKAQFSTVQQDIRLDSDLFASTFFMLSRWEEYANKERDVHQRFPAEASLAYQFDFLGRPIVNEYLEILKVLLRQIGYQGVFKKRIFKMIPTHDVDVPYLWWNNKQKLLSLARAVAALDPRFFFKHTRNIYKGIDPYDTFDLMMDASEKIGSESNFFFMAGGDTKYDKRYEIDNPHILKLIQHIKDRGHQIGFHPSYDAYKDQVLFKKEKEALEQAAQVPIKTGRQHYLRFELPHTWKIWSDFGFEWETTMTYAQMAGFRCGICFPFPVYDILDRKQLALYEKPTIVMEASIVIYQKLPLAAAQKYVDLLKSEVKKYQGEFVFLWHNSSFYTPQYEAHEKLLDQFYLTS